MVSVGVRAGLAVTMWSSFISARSARRNESLSVAPVVGLVAVSRSRSFSMVRVTASVGVGLPTIYIVGASSLWIAYGVVLLRWVSNRRLSDALISAACA